MAMTISTDGEQDEGYIGPPENSWSGRDVISDGDEAMAKAVLFCGSAILLLMAAIAAALGKF